MLQIHNVLPLWLLESCLLSTPTHRCVSQNFIRQKRMSFNAYQHISPACHSNVKNLCTCNSVISSDFCQRRWRLLVSIELTVAGWTEVTQRRVAAVYRSAATSWWRHLARKTQTECPKRSFKITIKNLDLSRWQVLSLHVENEFTHTKFQIGFTFITA